MPGFEKTPPRNTAVVLCWHGEPAQLQVGLHRLRCSEDLLSGVLVVVHSSEEGAAETLGELEAALSEALPLRWVHLPGEMDAAHFWHTGLAGMTASQILFLDATAEVPRARLERLLVALDQAPEMAAAMSFDWPGFAPFTVVAEFLAHCLLHGAERTGFAGFCLLARRSALREIPVEAAAGPAGDCEVGPRARPSVLSMLCESLRGDGWECQLTADERVPQDSGRYLLTWAEVLEQEAAAGCGSGSGRE